MAQPIPHSQALKMLDAIQRRRGRQQASLAEELEKFCEGGAAQVKDIDASAEQI